MKIFSALAVGVILGAGSMFGASVINSSTLNTLCTNAGANCGNVTFNTADQAIDSPLFGPLGIVTQNGTLTSTPFQGGVPFVNDTLGNKGNGFLPNTVGSFIDISVDAGNLSAIGFTVDQGIYGDGQGLQFSVFLNNNTQQSIFNSNTVVLDGCVAGNGSFIACPTFIGFQAAGGETITKVRISNATNTVGPENFNLYNLKYVVAGQIVTPPDPGAVPEPSTFGLMGAALLGLGAFARKFRK